MKITTKKIVVICLSLFAVWCVCIPLLDSNTKEVAAAYHNFVRATNSLEVDTWDDVLTDLKSGADDQVFIANVNSYQNDVRYLQELKLEKEPFYAEAVALSEVMQKNITENSTYEAWGHMNPNNAACLYLVGLPGILIFGLILAYIRDYQQSADEDELDDDSDERCENETEYEWN